MTTGRATFHATVEAVFVAAEATEPLNAVNPAEAIEGQGLAGDRYAAGRGTYSSGPKPGRQVTFISAEALERLAAERGVVLAPAEARRNVVTRGGDLMALVGRRFTVGTAVFIGVRDCPPCAHLERLTVPGVHSGLAGAGGLRADVVASGQFSAGDEIVLIADSDEGAEGSGTATIAATATTG